MQDAFHLVEDDFSMGDHMEKLTRRKELKKCRWFENGHCPHVYARNSSGRICGLLELDPQQSLPSDFEAIVLFDEKVWLRS